MDSSNKPDTHLERKLAEAVVDLVYDDLSESTVQVSERCFLDTTGVALAGTLTDPARTLLKILTGTRSSGNPLSFFTHYDKASSPDVAFLNGVAAHALDFDDDQFTILSHTSASLLPSVYALAERTDISGKDAITAHVVGFETQYILATQVNPEHYEQGWHATATLGTFGALATAAKLLDLSADQIRTGFGIAASMTSGLKRNFGTMTKPMHAGHAARNGTTAALLAAEGFTADQQAITGERGFLELYATGTPESPPDLRIPKSSALAEEGVYVKKYPCCYGTHRAIEIACNLSQKHNIDPSQVERVEVMTAEISHDNLPYDEPENSLQAKFSMPHTVACAIYDGDIKLRHFGEEALTHQTIASLRRRVEFTVDPSLEYTDPTTTIRIKLTDGSELQQSRQLTPGSPNDPLSQEELRAKFQHCAGQVLDDMAVSDVHDFLISLHERSQLNALFSMLK